MRKPSITVLRVLCLCAAVYVGHYVLYTVFDVYKHWPWFDAPMHLLGGMLAGLLGGALYRQGTEKHEGPWWKELLFILGCVALIATVWEFHEFLLDAKALYARSGGGGHQPSLDDTMKDLALGLFGGLLVYVGVWRSGWER